MFVATVNHLWADACATQLLTAKLWLLNFTR